MEVFRGRLKSFEGFLDAPALIIEVVAAGSELTQLTEAEHISWAAGYNEQVDGFDCTLFDILFWGISKVATAKHVGAEPIRWFPTY